VARGWWTPSTIRHCSSRRTANSSYMAHRLAIGGSADIIVRFAHGLLRFASFRKNALGEVCGIWRLLGVGAADAPLRELAPTPKEAVNCATLAETRVQGTNGVHGLLCAPSQRSSQMDLGEGI
jgi:hypothetical protein